VSGIFEALSADHREVEQLFEQYATHPDDTVARQICDALTIHAEVEERVLYPELRRIVDGGDDLADDAEAEHAAIRLLIARVHEEPPIDLQPLIDGLRDDVEQHVAVEEHSLFPMLRESGADAEALGRRLETARAEAAARVGARTP
jgi:hemerythrin superfamily protein